MNDDSKFNFIIKILIVGDSNVGKTNLINRYIDNTFNENIVNSIDFDIKTKIVKIFNKKILIKFFDTAGQEKFRSITKSLFQQVQGIILIYDITNEESFKNIEYWLSLIKENNLNFECILIGNKCDLENERKISKKDGLNFAKKNDIEFFETSCKTGLNIEKAIFSLNSQIYKNFTNFNMKKSFRLSEIDDEEEDFDKEQNNSNSGSCKK
jgi:small GTP-binding protein